CKFLLCVGRTLNCAMGVSAVVARSKMDCSKVVFVDPRMPEGALTGSEWIGIRPGTDSAFLLSLIHVGIAEKIVAFEFLAKHTNAPYLIEKGSHRPILAKEIVSGAADGAYVTMDKATGKFAVMAVKKNDKGAITGFDEPEGLDADLMYAGSVQTIEGTTLEVETVFAAFKAVADQYTPQEAAKITGIEAATIVRTARDFFTKGGVADDGWYASRNGNDTRDFALLSLMNVFAGNLDKEGGFVVTQGGGFKAPGVSLSNGKGKGPAGQTWESNGEKKALDKVYYPEGSGTYSAIFEAIETGKPYPIRAAFITGSTMFHREANSARMEKAFKALELMVVQDIFPHEVCDWADYVLPSTYFLEWHEYGGVKWALNGNVQINDAGIEPPADCEAREEIWQFCEILRRAFPDRAKDRLGYDKELKTRKEFRAWYDAMMDKAWKKFIDGKNAAKPGEGDRIAADVAKQGWAQTAVKKFGVYPYQKPFGTVTGKPELISFMFETKYGKKGASGLPNWVQAPGYTQPKTLSDEFYLVSGKDSASSSGTCIFTWPQKFLGDRTVWMNPIDAERLGIKAGDTIELTGIDTGVKGRAQVTVTNRVTVGSLFAHGFSGGVRTKTLISKEFEWVKEGINSHWFCTGYREPVVGSLSNNSSVRVKRV
ncbi:MAG: molybdopterin-dependent oxidoreductase, partial [Sutterellaceae bacterium]|nr:molybdopterin-dependent oxidoreductase [Sutterellaceae bacterium]